MNALAKKKRLNIKRYFGSRIQIWRRITATGVGPNCSSVYVTYMNAYLVAGSQVRRSTRMHYFYYFDRRFGQPVAIRY